MTRAAIVLVLLGACSSDDPCADVRGACLALSEGASAEEVQTALIEIEPGGTIAFGEGTFSFEVDLSLDVDDVTIKGAGQGATTLSFAPVEPEKCSVPKTATICGPPPPSSTSAPPDSVTSRPS